MSTAVNLSVIKPVTLADVALKAGVARSTAGIALSSNTQNLSQATVAKVKSVASELGYIKGHGRKAKLTPANPVFASREAETAAMKHLRKTGHTDKEVAHRCGVCTQTVINRIGTQPTELTKASKKLAGQIRSAKAQIKKQHQNQQTVNEYNILAAKLNAHLLEVQKMKLALSDKEKAAQAASKSTDIPLLRLLSFPSTAAQ